MRLSRKTSPVPVELEVIQRKTSIGLCCQEATEFQPLSNRLTSVQQIHEPVWELRAVSVFPKTLSRVQHARPKHHLFASSHFSCTDESLVFEAELAFSIGR